MHMTEPRGDEAPDCSAERELLLFYMAMLICIYGRPHKGSATRKRQAQEGKLVTLGGPTNIVRLRQELSGCLHGGEGPSVCPKKISSRPGVRCSPFDISLEPVSAGRELAVSQQLQLQLPSFPSYSASVPSVSACTTT